MDTDDTNIQMKIIVNIKYVELTLKKLLRIKFIKHNISYIYYYIINNIYLSM